MENDRLAASGVARAMRLRRSGRTLLILWAGFWALFNVLSGIVEASRFGTQGLLAHLAVAVAVAAVAVIAWRRELAGSILLWGLAGVALGVFDIQHWAVPTLLVLPPFLIGGLLFGAWRAGRRATRQAA